MMITRTFCNIMISKSLISGNWDELQVKDETLAYMVAVALEQYEDNN